MATSTSSAPPPTCGWGAYREAVALCDQILGTTPVPARRDNGVFLAHQATASAALPEPDRVVQIASAAAVVADTGSARFRRELKAVAGQAAGWGNSAARRELKEILSGVA